MASHALERILVPRLPDSRRHDTLSQTPIQDGRDKVDALLSDLAQFYDLNGMCLAYTLPKLPRVTHH